MLRSIRNVAPLSVIALIVSVAPVFAAGPTAEVVHSFVSRGGAGSLPLIEGSDGKLFGVDPNGGPAGYGEIFVLTPDGLGGFDYTGLHAFDGETDGRYPSSGLVRGADDLLYGTTSHGGAEDLGTLFRIDESGVFENWIELAAQDSVRRPNSLMRADDGSFYGTSSSGGDFFYGTVFRVDSGGLITVLESFTQFGVPVGPLAQGTDGSLYGSLQAATLGGNPGGVFRLTLAGDYSIVHSFNSTDGYGPGSLMSASDGTIYGTTSTGGADGNGVIFRIDTAGTFEVIYQAAVLEGPLGPPLTEGSDGKLYGSSLAGTHGAVFRFDAATSLFETLASFSETGAEGFRVTTWLQATDGDLYGVASEGGAGTFGTVVRFDLVNLESIHDFHALTGWSPTTGLVDGGDGWLYGTASTGGAFNVGTAFRLDGAGVFEELHTFTPDEGYSPELASAPLSGDLYGTAAGGQSLFGSFFRLDTQGSVDILHAFDGQPWIAPTDLVLASDGNFYGVNFLGDIFRIDSSGTPTLLATLFGALSPLTEGSDGALYGVQSAGGVFDQGTVFRMALDGTVSMIHDFTPLEGYSPNPGLLELSDGYFYGTTVFGGPSSGVGSAGTVFRVNPAGHFQTLYVFSPWQAGDGDHCNGELVEGSDGFLYGTTQGYGGGGSVFRLDKAWNQTVVHLFRPAISGDASRLNAGLLQAADGKLYGTSEFGGDSGSGAVYRIDPSTIIPVTSISPTSGPSAGGTPVTITGQQFQSGAVASIGIADTTDSVVGGDTELTATTPPVDAGMLHHVFVRNPDGSEGSLGRAFLADFLDVPQTDFFHEAVEKIFRNGITAGCSNGNYCRNSSTTRAQMAVFLLKSLLGRFYTPPPATGTVFTDVPADSFAAAWIEDLAARGITAGCGDNVFCPNGTVTRAQMAVFLLKTLLGTAYTPPPALGVFGDVPVGSFAADWIEDIYARGITAGCSSSELLYCPSSNVTRGQMAALLVATFNLP